MNHEQTFGSLRDYLRQTSLIEAAAALAEWDERTGMPRGAADFRAEQVAHLRGLVHARKTAPC